MSPWAGKLMYFQTSKTKTAKVWVFLDISLSVVVQICIMTTSVLVSMTQFQGHSSVWKITLKGPFSPCLFILFSGLQTLYGFYTCMCQFFVVSSSESQAVILGTGSTTKMNIGIFFERCWSEICELCLLYHYQPIFWGDKRLNIKQKSCISVAVWFASLTFVVVVVVVALPMRVQFFVVILQCVCVVWLASVVDFDFVCANALPAALFDFVCLQWWLFSQRFKRTSLLIPNTFIELAFS